MTRGELKDYLVALPSPGVDTNARKGLADAAIEAGYAGVWGAHPWKVRRVLDSSLTTTGSQAYTTLPEDFESLHGVRILYGNRPSTPDAQDEQVFDMNFPYPANDNNNRPNFFKVSHDSATNLWRLYWYPVPDASYTLAVLYDKKADSGALPNLPSHMLPAVMVACASYMVGINEGRAAYDEMSERHLRRAIMSDRVVSGYSPRLGADPGWNDWVTGKSMRGSTEWWSGAQL